ncbi:BspA family leucine-rich repeat surface protein, partial [Oribacterium sp. NK2B42]|uniref:BspA family leucine-rich repeat surface protein n=1 Tax=Oribacterium sp. NK2B42 TaxID=689781 RepID=UPI0012EB6766
MRKTKKQILVFLLSLSFILNNAVIPALANENNGSSEVVELYSEVDDTKEKNVEDNYEENDFPQDNEESGKDNTDDSLGEDEEHDLPQDNEESGEDNTDDSLSEDEERVDDTDDYSEVNENESSENTYSGEQDHDSNVNSKVNESESSSREEIVEGEDTEINSDDLIPSDATGGEEDSELVLDDEETLVETEEVVIFEESETTAAALEEIMQIDPVTTAYPIDASIDDIEYELDAEKVVFSDLDDSDELFKQYVDSLFGTSGTGKRLFKAPRSSKLTGINKDIYPLLKEKITQIANGEESSTLIEIPLYELFDQYEYTAEELGLESFVENGSITTEAENAFYEKIGYDSSALLNAIRLDCPYELYWYDKKSGCTSIFNVSWYRNRIEINSDSVLKMWFAASEDYIPEGAELQNVYSEQMYLEVDTAKTGAAKTAVENANYIIDNAEGLSDYGKLEYFKDSICNLVDYNYDALTDDTYGDPWQIVNVFDGNENTKVVCEGYAKAFKYLCDKSQFDYEDFDCYIVNGTTSGRHMWNIVHMKGGANYLVDVTNMDEGMSGYPDLLFLKGATKTSDANCYRFFVNNINGYIDYLYSEETLSNYSSEELTLATSDYVVSQVTEQVLTGGGITETIYWGINEEGELRISASALPEEYTGGNFAGDTWFSWYSPWYSERSKIYSVVVGEDNNLVIPEYTEYWFSDLSNVTKIDLNGLDTSNVKQMDYMFKNCTGLTELDVSSIDTSNATCIAGMFYGCSGLKSIDVSKFDTSNAEIMSSMFSGCSGLTKLDVSGFDTSNVSSMDDMFNGCSSLTSLDVSKFDTSNAEIMSSMFSGCSGLTKLDVSGFDTSNVYGIGLMFQGCSGLTSLDVSGFDTSNVRYMNCMFDGCSGLTSLDVSGFKTSNVEGMSSMFKGCSNLAALDLSNFDTSKVTRMDTMFYNCSSLTTLDLSSFDTSKVTHMTAMFKSCWNLSSIVVSESWTTTNAVQYGNQLFSYCTSLVGGAGTKYDIKHTDVEYAHIDGGSENPGYFTKGSAANGGSTSGKSLNGWVETADGWRYYNNDEYVTNQWQDKDGYSSYLGSDGIMVVSDFVHDGDNTYYMDQDGRMLVQKWFSVDNDWYWPDQDGTLIHNTIKTINGNRFAFGDDCKMLRGYVSADLEEINDTEDPILSASYYFNQTGEEPEGAMVTGWHTYKGTLNAQRYKDYSEIKVYFDPETGKKIIDQTKTIDEVQYEFDSYGIVILNTQQGGITETIYWGINSDGELRISASVLSDEYTGGSFAGDALFDWNTNAPWYSKRSRINSVVVGEDKDPVIPLYTSYWFSDLSKAKKINLSGLDTSNVKDMGGMFSNCTGLASLDVSSFNTSNVKNMRDMFCWCTGLTSLDVSNFDTSNVEDMSDMFDGCSTLTSLNVSKFDTSNVTNMSYMFNYCSGLTALDLSGFNTSNVKFMAGMFRLCSGLTTLDLSSFDTSIVTDMGSMFQNCGNLSTILVSENWTTNAVQLSNQMFTYSTSLVGGAGTKYDSGYTDVEYAHIDGGSENPGYLTDGSVVPSVELKITEQPQDATAEIGSNVTWRVVAEGEGLSYDWEFKYAGTTVWKKTAVSVNGNSSLTLKMKANYDGMAVR